MKTCRKCNELKPFDQFPKRKDSKDKLGYWCKPCCKVPKEYHQEYYKKTIDKCKQRAIKWRETNDERYKENSKKWRESKHDHYIEGINKHLNSIQSGVYMVKNLITGECYIGQSKRPYTRRVSHFSTVGENKKHSTNPKLQEAMKQYGSELFVFGIIEHCEPEQLLEREQYYINLFNPEYNVSKSM